MQFHSYGFLFFFPLVLLCVWIFPRRMKNGVLLAASYLFYASWGLKYCLVLLAAAALAYLAGLLLERRRWILPGALVLLFGLLGVFKYTPFVLSNLARLGLPVNGSFRIAAPLGISFFTFQAAGYLWDVRRGKYPAERNFLRFALFVSFFPQLLTGPIGRGDRLLPQYAQCRKPEYEDLRAGFLIMTWGYFQKLVIADRAAMLVDTVYGDYGAFSGSCLALATVVYALQIYCDFAGCSCIAIGGARMLGIRLGKNFDAPYFSGSISEFWRRWHISLSTWFRDYVYFPLGGSRCGLRRTCVNIMVVFLISGAWHGASWGFLAWGVLHGAYQVIGRLTKDTRARSREKLGIDAQSEGYQKLCAAVTFLLVCAAWVLFRADRLHSALAIWKRIALDFQPTRLLDALQAHSLGLDGPDSMVLLLSAGLLYAVDRAQYRGTDPVRWFGTRCWPVRELLLAGLILLTFFLGIWGNGFHGSGFIYAQF